MSEAPAPEVMRLGFSGEDAPALEDLQNCIHCGFCLPACPTYIATGHELESPRGRLHLIRGVLDGKVEATDRLISHLDLCLQCRACETACPSSVPYGRIMEDARASIVADPALRPSSWTWRTLLLRRVLTAPWLLRLLLGGARVSQRLGLRALVRGRVGDYLPQKLRDLEAQGPVLRGAPFRRRGTLASPAEAGERVALLLGCVHGEIYPQTHEATVRVLARLGCEVVAPERQVCCGALHTHAGDAETARDLARRNIEAFEHARVDAVIVNAAGCGAAMKEYGRLLRNDRRWAERAEQFASKVRDVLEFVADRDFEHGLGPVDASVTLQDACHLAHGQGIRDAPRRILRAIPGLELRELATPDRCCGSAGIYSVVQPEMSRTVLDAKLADIAHTDASIVATANIGCTLQIQSGLRATGSTGHPPGDGPARHRAAGPLVRCGRPVSKTTNGSSQPRELPHPHPPGAREQRTPSPRGDPCETPVSRAVRHPRPLRERAGVRGPPRASAARWSRPPRSDRRHHNAPLQPERLLRGAASIGTRGCLAGPPHPRPNDGASLAIPRCSSRRGEAGLPSLAAPRRGAPSPQPSPARGEGAGARAPCTRSALRPVPRAFRQGLPRVRAGPVAAVTAAASPSVRPRGLSRP